MNEDNLSPEELGFAYLQGIDCIADFEQAFYWLTIAKNEGSKKARLAIGEMYAKSLGVKADIKEAECLGWNENIDSFLDNAPTDNDFRAMHAKHASSNAIEGPSIGTCPACGMNSLISSAAYPGAFFCSGKSGGCGSHLFLPVVESGLKRGLSIQPYSEPPENGSRPIRSFFGHCVHTLKYDGRANEGLRLRIIDEVARRLIECKIIERVLGERNNENVIVVPVPSSVRRTVQPVSLLSEMISRNRFECRKALNKRNRIESKSRATGAELEPGEISCAEDLVIGKDILLIDDTYGEGATLRACIRTLKDSGANDIYYLSLCKNIYGGMKGGAGIDDSIR